MSLKISPEYQRGVVVICVAIILYIFGRACVREAELVSIPQELQDKIQQDSIYSFDPNTVELAELLGFGLSKSEALSIIRYRSAGKVFNIKEEVIGCYGISDSLYFALEPYIVIGEEFRYKNREYSQDFYSKKESPSSYKSITKKNTIAPSKFLVDTVSVKYLEAIGALTARQSEVFVKWRDMSGIHSMEELRECYVVSEESAQMLEPYIIFTKRKTAEERRAEKVPVDLNRADIAELISVSGIGEKSALAILDFRDALGGFYSVEQLSQIKIITESNYEKIIQQIMIDSCDISKIDVNFASAKELSGHPYIGSKQLRKLLKQRQLKGGWRTLEEMIEDKIFTTEEAQQVRPYLLFSELGEFHKR
ncbi:MAG: helix-hairpin-helix domain-containing protein [Rikenellaceae bacterium]